MYVLIQFLIALNVMLATALFVVNIALMDSRYAKRVRDDQQYKSYFRRRD